MNEVLSTRNSQTHTKQQQQQQQQQGRNGKEIKPEEKVQLQIQTIRPIQPKTSTSFQMNHEHLDTAQHNNLYQHQKLLTPMKTLYDLINVTPIKRSDMPVRRRRHKSRRTRNHLEEKSNFWSDRMDADENRNDIAYTISLGGKNKSNLNISNHLNQSNDFQVETKNYKIWSNVKAENVLEAPFATSTSAGKTQMIIISSSRSISKSTNRTGNSSQQHNTKHRMKTNKQRSFESPRKQSYSGALDNKHVDNKYGKLQNIYNIDYDNRLEDEYEIIMKDE